MKTDFNLLTLFSNPNNISIAKSYDRYDNVLSIDLEQVENGYHVDAVVRVRSEEFLCSFTFDSEYHLHEYQCVIQKKPVRDVYGYTAGVGL